MNFSAQSITIVLLCTTAAFAIIAPPVHIPSSCNKSTRRYLSLSDDELYAASTRGSYIGGCQIRSGSRHSVCDLYVVSATMGNQGHRGWPRNKEGLGTGCVKAPDFPKRVSKCIFEGDEYQLTSEERSSFCTDSGKANALAQIRHSIRNGQCLFPGCSDAPTPPPRPSSGPPSNVQQFKAKLQRSDIVPEAYSGDWKCSHSSGKGSCFLSTAVSILKGAGSCVPCVEEIFGGGSTSTPPIGSDGELFLGDGLSNCSSCIENLKDAPKCGGKFLGIGSAMKGHSCKLIDGGGCWPKTSHRVVHDCGKGAECRFKVSDAKAKIWCCAPKKSGFFSFAHNLLRCTSRAKSKSKDRDGAQVLWE